MSSFYAWYCSVATTTTGSWRSYATPYTATAPSGNNAYRMTFGFDLTDGANLPYCQNFEDGDGQFQTGGILNSWEYGEPDNTNISSAYSGDYAWVTDLDGNYNNDELSYVRTPRYDMTQLVDPVVKFWTIRDLETGDDGVSCQVSADSGATWATLGSTSSNGPWYNSSTISALSSLGNGNGWTGQNLNWTPMQHSLASFTSDTAVFLRWQMAADGNTAAEGFGLDDILIGESNDVSITELFYPDSVCGLSGMIVSARICNRSVVEKYGFDIDLDTNGTTVSYSYPDTLPVCGCDTVDLVSINGSAGGTWNLFAEVVNSGDVNAANDTISGTMLTYGTPAVMVVGGGNHCQGEVDTVSFVFQGTSPFGLSYTNGTTPYNISNITSNPFQILVSTSGIYEAVYVTDGSGCPGDTSGLTGQAVVNFFPAPIIDLGPDSAVCQGYVLNAGAGFSNYQWSTGQTNQTIVANQTNVFSVTVTDSIGCEGSDIVDLEVFPKPVVTLTDTVLCEGGTFLFNAGGGAAGYVWHNGAVGQLFAMDSIGTVSVTVTSFFGCTNSASASITAIVPNPTPSITSSSSLAPVTLNAGPGYSAYQWNNNATTQTISVSVAGTYTCTVTDSHGCKGSDNQKAKIWPTGIKETIEANGVIVYPNPSQDFIWVEVGSEFASAGYDLELRDAAGRIVRYETGISGFKFQLNLSGLAHGQYTLMVLKDQRSFTSSFVIGR